MTIRGKRFLLTASVLGLMLAGAGPALAQNHGGGGGGHSGGGGGHSGGGGGHVGGGGGAHLTGGGHVSAGYAGSHFSGSSHYAGSAYSGGYAGRGGSPAAYHGAGAGAYHGGYAYRGNYGGHGGYGYPGHYYGHGYSTGAYWRGGYWHGGYWPRCYYGAGFAWFLPVLPLAYATYWWGGLPYYYANDVYYTWSPDYQGYVATDPPPATESGSGAAVSPSDALPDTGSPPPGGAPAQIFMYPKNGQSTEQQAQDRAECQQWATQQAGSVAQNGPDYNRAMVACVEGRGYSAR
jgi:hypothetical protein